MADRAKDPTSELAAELAKLSPAERYERLIDFPTNHTFKVIGAADQSFVDALREALAAGGHAEVDLSHRFSQGARYVAYTFDLPVENGAALVDLYERLGALPGLKYLL